MYLCVSTGSLMLTGCKEEFEKGGNPNARIFAKRALATRMSCQEVYFAALHLIDSTAHYLSIHK